jgi:hypothetical protein
MTLASLLSLSLGRASSLQRHHALTGRGADGRRFTLTFASAAGRSSLFGKAFQ